MDIWGECFKSTLETQAKVLLRTWMFVFREEQRSQSGWNGESEEGGRRRGARAVMGQVVQVLAGFLGDTWHH